MRGRIIFGSSHLSREREDFRADYNSRWGNDDEREWDDEDQEPAEDDDWSLAD